MDGKSVVSIIIPTYYSEKYLDQCLEKIVNQTYSNVEIIICDSESGDGTLEIIKKYQKKYDNIKVIQVEHKGVSHSRNVGILHATGDYIEFVDSDDYLSPTGCENLVRAMEKYGADIVMAGYEIMQTGLLCVPSNKIYHGTRDFVEDMESYYLPEYNCLNSPCNKMYRRDKISVLFPEDIDKGEDLFYNLKVLEQADVIVSIPDIVYRVNIENDNSLSRGFRDDAVEIETMIHKKIIGFVKKYKGEIPNYLYQKYINGIKNKFYSLTKYSGYSFQQCRRKIRKWCEVQEIAQLSENYKAKRKKDKILLFMLRHKMSALLYIYFRYIG